MAGVVVVAHRQTSSIWHRLCGRNWCFAAPLRPHQGKIGWTLGIALRFVVFIVFVEHGHVVKRRRYAIFRRKVSGLGLGRTIAIVHFEGLGAFAQDYHLWLVVVVFGHDRLVHNIWFGGFLAIAHGGETRERISISLVSRRALASPG